jgi:hypothetical protein
MAKINGESSRKPPEKTASIAMGHMNQQMMSMHSTHPNKEPACDFQAHPPIEDGINTHIVYAAMVDVGQIYTDQTGSFNVQSRRFHKYIMVLYDFNINGIWAQPIKNCTEQELSNAVKMLNNYLIASSLNPKSQITKAGQ